MRGAIAILFVAAVLALVVGCTKWRFDECKKVGHSTLYCVVQAGQKHASATQPKGDA